MTENTTTQTVKRTCPEGTRRKPGGQPGNRNAFKHGLRSRALTPIEREELKARIIHAAVQQAESLLRQKVASYHERQEYQGFVGAETTAGGNPPSSVKRVIKAFVLLDPSRVKGFINLKTCVTMPLPEILTSQAKLMESILEMMTS